jgi:hypothetical protein
MSREKRGILIGLLASTRDAFSSLMLADPLCNPPTFPFNENWRAFHWGKMAGS